MCYVLSYGSNTIIGYRLDLSLIYNLETILVDLFLIFRTNLESYLSPNVIFYIGIPYDKQNQLEWIRRNFG